jgi:hypothetical protein
MSGAIASRLQGLRGLRGRLDAGARAEDED